MTQTTEKKSISDHLAEAMHSHDLSAGHDVDYLTALGMTGVKSNRASAIFRLVNTLDLASYQTALMETVKLVRRLNAVRSWNMQPRAQNALAKSALDYFICPVCPICQGRKYELIKGTPNLSPIGCKHCQGSGIKKPAKAMRDRILEIVSELECCIGVMVGGVRQRIHGTGG
jgi:hypothetical protein